MFFFEWKEVLILFIGGMLVTNGSNIINQIIERTSDKEMKRTRTRPLPAGRMGVQEAWIITLISAVAGITILWVYFNALTGILSFISLLLYAFAYTPMKKIHPVATFIGAIPGALPPLIGWAAATGSIFAGTDLVGWTLFMVQFFWQFPHFWAIAWLGYEEYLKAGISMLPSKEGKTSFTGLQCMFYALPLIPVGMLPYFLQVVGKTGSIFAVGFGVFFTLMAINFYLKSDNRSAKKLLYSSFIYLPGVLLSFALDKL
ncbi:MAG: heme o synthase [Taibaiella sp.]|nr:heme o synthase [Taibaiella sp.]